MYTCKQFLKRNISFDMATRLILAICLCVIIFHLLIIFKIIPYDIVRWWRLTNDAEMLKFESISLLLNVLIMVFVAMKWWFIKYFLPARLVSLWLRWLFFLLVWNTIANIFSETLFEAVFFTFLTWLLTILIYRLQIE